MQKNVAAQKIQMFAFNTSTGAPTTGDAANLTAYVSKDHAAVTVLADTSATEMDATNAPGVYVFDLAQAETNADELTFTAKSSTGSVSITPRFVTTVPVGFAAQVAQTGDAFARLGAPAGASVSADIAAVKVDTAAILVDTNELQTDWANGGRLDLILDARASQASVDTVDGVVDAILVDTAVIGAAGAGLTAVPWNAAWDAEVQSEVADALAVYDPPTNAELTAATSPLATAANLATVAGYLDTEIAAILADTNELQTDWANGGRLDLILDARASQTSVDDLPTNAELSTALGTADDATLAAIAALSIPSAATVADAVWDEPLAGHAGVGSTGAALSAAGGSGDPWSTALPGAYGAGTAGQIVGDYINASVSSRASQTSVDDLPTNAELSTALGTADDAVLAQVALVKAKTDNLPADPADASDIAAALAAIEGEFAALATQASVDDLPTNAELSSALGALSIPTAAAIADAVHDEVVEGTTTLRQSVRLANAVLGGKASGLETATATYRDLADSKDRVVATVDADGNRSAVTRDLT